MNMGLVTTRRFLNSRNWLLLILILFLFSAVIIFSVFPLSVHEPGKADAQFLPTSQSNSLSSTSITVESDLTTKKHPPDTPAYVNHVPVQPLKAPVLDHAFPRGDNPSFGDLSRTSDADQDNGDTRSFELPPRYTVDPKMLTRWRPPMPKLPEKTILDIVNDSVNTVSDVSISNSEDADSSTVQPTPPTYRFEVNEKLVHFDLKGAPLKVSYLRDIFPVLRQLGATGLLMEYEDMFPYGGPLSVVKSKIAYTTQDIESIRRYANESGLEIIPLVQTFGHLEFVLKHKEFAYLREVPKYPTALCPSNNDSFALVRDLIDQNVAANPESKFIHIGADEVFQLGKCPVCSNTKDRSVKHNHKLFLSFVSQTLSYIKTTYPNIKPIMWDDMFRGMQPSDITAGLGDLRHYVEVMIWSYYQDPMYHLPNHGELYKDVFTNFWGATAFKGSAGEGMQIPDVNMQVAIHTSWLDVLERKAHLMMNFRGIALSGWSRYDHFNPLCELFPTAVPTLGISLEVLKRGGFSPEAVQLALDVLKCANKIKSLNTLLDDPQLWRLRKCAFPGADIYKVAQSTQRTIDKTVALIEEVDTRFPKYHTSNGYGQPEKAEKAIQQLTTQKRALLGHAKEAAGAFPEAYEEATLHEWVEEQIHPWVEEIDELTGRIEEVVNLTGWESRPLGRSELLEHLDEQLGGVGIGEPKSVEDVIANLKDSITKQDIIQFGAVSNFTMDSNLAVDLSNRTTQSGSPT